MTPQAPQAAPEPKKGLGVIFWVLIGCGVIMAGVACIAIVAAIAIPNLLRSRMAANESAAMAMCKTFASAEDIYRRTDYDGDKVLEYAQTLRELGDQQLLDRFFVGADSANPSPIPKAGYYFKVLKMNGPGAPGGTKSYLNGGNMTLGYALLAYPAAWDGTGRNCFLINNNGTIYQKDLGQSTDATAKSMNAYDPSGWIVAE